MPEGEASRGGGAVWCGGQDSELRARRTGFLRRAVGIVTASQNSEKSYIQPAVKLIPVRAWSSPKGRL